MTPTPPLLTRWSLVSTLALAAALAACGQAPDDDRTAGQRLDSTLAEARQAARETQRDARQAVQSAERSAVQAADVTARATIDLAITTKVNTALALDDKLHATDIVVSTHDGRVTLTGHAPDAASRDRAATLASAVDGVKQVDNQLGVSRRG